MKSDKIIHETEELVCTARTAFAYFTQNNLLETWLTAQAEVEAIPGGKYELFWDPANRQENSTIGCHITAIQQDQLVAFEWRSPAQFKQFANQADPLTHVVVSFIPEGRTTTVHLVHSGWRSTMEWEEARIWQEKAWRLALNRLKELHA